MVVLRMWFHLTLTLCPCVFPPFAPIPPIVQRHACDQVWMSAWTADPNLGFRNSQGMGRCLLQAKENLEDGNPNPNPGAELWWER